MASRGRFAAEALASLPSDSNTPPAAAPLMPPPAGIPTERGSLGWPLPEPRAHRRPAQHSGDRTVGGRGRGTSATWLAPETPVAAAAACGGAEQDALATVSLGVAAATEKLLRAAEESGAAQQQLEAAVEALTAVESRAAAGLRSRLELLARRRDGEGGRFLDASEGSWVTSSAPPPKPPRRVLRRRARTRSGWSGWRHLFWHRPRPSAPS